MHILFLLTFIHFSIFLKNIGSKGNNLPYLFKKEDYNDKKFIVIQRICDSCGLFSHFMVNLGCIHKYLIDGYIPIIDLKSFPNVINGFNISKSNYWEIFFEQPYGYTLDEVIKNSKNITNITCYDCKPRLSCMIMPFSDVQTHFWHDFARKYIPIKKEIFIDTRITRKKIKNC